MLVHLAATVLSQEYSVEINCTGDSQLLGQIINNVPYCYMNITDPQLVNNNISSQAYNFYINDSAIVNEIWRFVGPSPYFSIIGNNEYIVFEPGLSLSTLPPVFSIIKNGLVTDRITAIYSPNITVGAVYNSTAPPDCNSISLNPQTVSVTFSDTNTLTNGCGATLVSMATISGTVLNVTYRTCIGSSHSQQVAVQMALVDITVAQPVYIFKNQSLNFDMEVRNVVVENLTSADIVTTNVQTNITILNRNSSHVSFNLVVLENVNMATSSLNFQVQYVYVCNIANKLLHTQQISATPVRPISLSFDSSPTVLRYYFEITSNEFCPNSQIDGVGLPDVTCTPNTTSATQNCTLNDNYSYTTDLSSFEAVAIVPRIQNPGILCSDGSSVTSAVFLQGHIPAVDRNLKCTINTTTSGYLRLFDSTIDNCAKSLPNALVATPDPTANVTALTLRTCTNEVFQFNHTNAFYTVTPRNPFFVSDATGAGVVEIELTGNLPAGVNLYVTDPQQNVFNCNPAGSVYTCTANVINNDYMLNVEFTDDCNNLVNETARPLLYPTGQVNVVCLGVCYIDLGDILSQNLTFQQFSHDNNNLDDRIGSLNRNNQFVFSTSQIQVRHVGDQARIRVVDGNNNPLYYGVVYNNDNWTITAQLNRNLSSAELCTNWTTLLTQSALDVRVVLEDCRPTVNSVNFTAYNTANINVTNCFSKTKVFYNFQFSTVTATNVSQSLVAAESALSWVVLQVDNTQQQLSSTNVWLEQNGTRVQTTITVQRVIGYNGRYNISFPSNVLNPNTLYELRATVTGICGQSETIAHQFVVTSVTHTIPFVAANCTQQYNCTYALSYSVVGMYPAQDCSNMSVTFTAPTGVNVFTATFTEQNLSTEMGSLLGNIPPNSIYLGDTYTTSSPSVCMDAQTAIFVDQTGFAITQNTRTSCTIRHESLLAYYFNFTNNNTQASLSVNTVGGRQTVTYRSVLNQNYTFEFDYIECSYAIAEAPNKSASVMLVPGSDGLVTLTVAMLNIHDVTIGAYRANSGTMAGSFVHGGNTTYTLNTSSMSTGEYNINISYTDACGYRETETLNISISLSYRAKLFCINDSGTAGAGGNVNCTVDFNNNLTDWNGASMTLTSIPGINSSLCNNFSSCTCGQEDPNNPGTIIPSYKIQFNNVDITCDTNNVFNLVVGQLNTPVPQFQLVYIDNTGATTNITTVATILLYMEQSDVVVANFSVREFPTNYVCFERFSASDLTFEVQNAPPGCPPRIREPLEFVDYNVVNMDVEFCGLVVRLTNQSFKISRLVIQNTTQTLFCDGCVVQYAIYANQSQNAVLSRLNVSSFRVQVRTGSAPAETWADTGIPVRNLRNEENLTTFDLATAGMTQSGSYRFYVEYYDVCYYQNRLQNQTSPIAGDSVEELPIEAIELNCATQNCSCGAYSAAHNGTYNMTHAYRTTKEYSNTSVDLSACIQNPNNAQTWFELKDTDVAKNYSRMLNVSITDAGGTGIYTLTIDYTGDYLVKTDKSASALKTYIFRSDNVNCENALRDKQFLFVDRTGAAVSPNKSRFCSSELGYDDLNYIRTDCCSGNISNSNSSVAAGMLTYTQWSCLDYAFPTFTQPVEISSDQVTVVFDAETDVVTVGISGVAADQVVSVLITSTDSNNGTVSTVGTCTALLGGVNFSCRVASVPNGGYNVTISMASSCVINKPFDITRNIWLLVSDPFWDPTITNCNTIYTGAVYNYSVVPLGALLRVDANDTNCSFLSGGDNTAQGVFTSPPDPTICSVNVTHLGVDVSYNICVVAYSYFNISRCGIYFSDYDSERTETESVVVPGSSLPEEVPIVRSLQNYNVRCMDDRGRIIPYRLLSADGQNAIARAAGAGTLAVRYCSGQVGCIQYDKSLSIAPTRVPDNRSDYLNMAPQEKQAVIRYLANVDNQTLLRIVLDGYDAYNSYHDLLMLPGFMDKVQNRTLYSQMLRDAFTYGFDQERQYAYFNQETYDRAFAVYQKAISELDISAQEKLQFAQRMLDTLTGPVMGLNINYHMQDINITIMSTDEFQSGAQNITGIHSSVSALNITPSPNSSIAGISVTEYIDEGVPYQIVLINNQSVSYTLSAEFTGSDSGTCAYYVVQDKIRLDELGYISGGSERCTTTATGARVISCLCQNINQRGVLYLENSNFTQPPLTGARIALIVLNSLTLIAAVTLMCVAAYLVHKNRTGGL